MRLAVLLALAGCDKLIVINERDPETCNVAPGDEDGDCALDGDDNCPAQANDQSDADRDGVGDTCDPDTQSHSFEFESFVDPIAAATRWRDVTSSPWSFVAGRARHDDPGDVASLLQRTAPTVSTDTTIDATFVFTAWAGDPADSMPEIRIAVRIDGDPDTANGHACRIEPSSQDVARAYITDATGTQTPPAPMKGITVATPTTDAPIRLRLRRTSDELRCEVTMGAQPPIEIVHARGGATWPTARHVGVDAGRTVVALEHVTIFALR